MKKQEHWIPDNEQVSSYNVYTSWFTYDSLNRLQSTNGEKYASGPNTVTDSWKQTFIYDRYGNRTIDTNSSNTYGAGINNKSFTVDTSTNRLLVPSGQSGAMSYDSSGYLVAVGRFRFAGIGVWEPWFYLGAILFTLNTWGARRWAKNRRTA